MHKILTVKKQRNSFRGKCLETKQKYRVLKLQFIRSRVLYLQYFLQSARAADTWKESICDSLPPLEEIISSVRNNKSRTFDFRVRSETELGERSD